METRSVEAAERLNLNADVAYILVATEGRLLLDGIEAGSAVLEIGDLILLPHGSGSLVLTAGAERTGIIVCRFTFDPNSLREMISALPERIHTRYNQGAEWLGGMIHFMMRETVDVEPGAALMISRIIDLLIIHTLRTWIGLGHVSGWLGGLSDARIARVLRVMHEKPTRPSSIEELAEMAGMSRSSFADRFTELVGRTPLRYQNEWRLSLARDMLIRRDARVGEIGLRIGYEAEAAFSRAYKALLGNSPRDETLNHR